MGTMRRLPIVLLLAVSAAFAQDYAREVAPVLQKRCGGCHGATQQMAGLRVDDASAMRQRAVIVPGKSADSVLVQRITSPKAGFRMPPSGPALTPEEIGTIREWIDAGASAPVTATAAAANARHPHWSFQPIARPAVPVVSRKEWLRNEVDSFILARLESNGIEPSPEAPKTTLLRRLSLDLTGLPPTPAEIAEFLADGRPDAYERLVDRLLASRHYGEKWARQWLDLARYADSDGYEKDLVRPWAWRYRNWVIEALNRGMPFDQFTTEQLAGDLLPHPTVEQRIATGFHRNVLTNREAGVNRDEARFEQNINRTNTIGTVWLGLTVGCAQCHNHKYDPISQRDYYGLFAYAANLEEDDIDAPLPGEVGPFLRSFPEYERERKAILAEYDVLSRQQKYEERLAEAAANPGTNLEWDFQVTEFKASVDKALKLLRTPWEQRTRKDQAKMTMRFLRVIGPDFNRDKELTAKLKEAREKLTKLDAGFTPLSEAMAIREDGNPPLTHLAVGGDYRNPGDEVRAAVPAVIGGKPIQSRLELARWLMAPENPLTARVAVNRMWQEFFGRGLVRTSDDFGTQGDKPSHPELLDWLASEFRDGGWNTKRMHKLIVMSAAYRQSSKIRKELLVRDPENTMIARQNRLRLPAESIRDAALAAGGLLNATVGGRSIRPPQPPGIAELGYANSVKWVESQGPERYRRGLYIHFQRTAPYPMLMTFDAPDSNVACTRRSRSNTPLQALNLLNDAVFLEAAQGLALRVLSESPGDRVEYAFRLCTGRTPTEREKQRLSTYLDAQRTILGKDPAAAAKLMPVPPEGSDALEAAAWTGVGRVLLNLDEFITRE